MRSLKESKVLLDKMLSLLPCNAGVCKGLMKVLLDMEVVHPRLLLRFSILQVPYELPSQNSRWDTQKALLFCVNGNAVRPVLYSQNCL